MDRGENVMMVRADLEGVPAHSLPEGYSLRRYRPGDAKVWTRIWTAADRFGSIAPETFIREFGDCDDVLAERQLYLCGPDGREVGTATAWFGRPEIDSRAGVVHWVAVLPEMQGTGLAKPLMSAVLGRLRALGYGRAYLITQEARAAAVNLYLRFGFRPEIRDEPERAAWERLRARLPGSLLDDLSLEERS